MINWSSVKINNQKIQYAMQQAKSEIAEIDRIKQVFIIFSSSLDLDLFIYSFVIIYYLFISW